METKTNNITVYYDASCPKCVKDRKNYEKMAGASGHDVCWMDITGRDEELRQLGIDPHQALTELHLKDQHGRILSEIDAYILLMQRVPRLRILARLIALPVIRPCVAFLYHHMVMRRLRREGRL
ncbi:MAG: thiol-disulfide oxidoreductase DCC family protein [Mariprofundus sp.]